jgi:AhpD family alkylhydroperoxidase
MTWEVIAPAFPDADDWHQRHPTSAASTADFDSDPEAIMHSFPVHTLHDAPEPSRAALAALNDAFGRLPNVAAAMAGAPVLLNSLVALFRQVHAGSFTEPEIQAVLLTNAVANACPWAVAFHTALALDAGLDAADVDAIRSGRAPRAARPRALSNLARTLIARRGALADADVATFIAAGFTDAELLEAITVVAASTLTNYTANVTHPPLEADFLPYAWTAPAPVLAAE